MISNYFTLLEAARLLDARLMGAAVAEVYTQEKRRLCVGFSGFPPSSTTTIVLSCVPAENAVYATAPDARARRNSTDLFPAAVGRRVTGVECDGMDRILTFHLEGGYDLRCEFFGVRANILAFGPEGRLLDAFLHKEELLDAACDLPKETTMTPVPRPEDAWRVTGSREEFSQRFHSGTRQTALAALKYAVPKLGAVLAEEMLFRAGIDAACAPAHVSMENLHRLYDSALQSVGDLLDYTRPHEPRIYWEERRAVCFSIVPLESKHMLRQEGYSDLLEAVRRYVASERARESVGAEHASLQTWLVRERERAERTLAKMEEDARSHDRADDYERFGTLLMAQLYRISKGMTSIVLEDFESGAPVEIALDPALAPAANAERYYRKARHARQASVEASERRRSLARRIENVEHLLSGLGQAGTREELREFHRRFGAQLKESGYMTDTEREQLPPFRIFTVEGGFQVLAGKSSENNDLLTVKYARPNDLWFHARGSSGSHVVLRVGSASGTPTKKAIEQAASIAAYYSKMKNARAVPVAMTEKKFVHKPKGVPAGTVTLDREKVIFVEPKLPDTA
ncbi:MAG: NFACT family protein [Acidobacteriota bacterium]